MFHKIRFIAQLILNGLDVFSTTVDSFGYNPFTETKRNGLGDSDS